MPCRLTLVLALVAFANTARGQQAPLIGFSAEGAGAQQKLERQFDATLKAGNLRDWMQRMTARPHHVGSPHGKANAELIASLLKSWGYETSIETFEILFPVPRKRVVEMIAPARFRASLAEKPLAEDRTSNQTAEILPPYNAFSTDGDVTGELVYVNYGVPADYEVLERNGVDVRGKVVIARYGGSWRGIKPKVAAEHGAIGCLIYSDPRDDGYFRGDVYPKGAFRNEWGAQRGSVMDMPLYPGDPLTPGVGATKDASRLDRRDAKTITRIPVLPISYSDALPLLRNLGGPVAPAEWRGALPITYHLGSGPARVRLAVEFDWQLRPIYDVIARLPGRDLPDQWIMRGNHHDAWVHGANDPVSGLVAMLEEARAVAELTRTGWRPRRTIVYAAWDAEEPALIGSTEWVEAHIGEVREKVAVYINSDSNARGFLDVGGSHTLERVVTEVARDVEDPQRKVSVLDRMRARELTSATSPEQIREIRERKRMRLDALGSGSDYTPFLQHAGVASLSVGYGGEGSGGSYHSMYDSFDHFTRFVDPGFAYGLTQARTTGRLVLRMANAEVLPFEAETLAETISGYLGEVMKLAKRVRGEIDDRNRQLEERTMELAADPLQPFVAPPAESPAPVLEFAPLENAVVELERAAKELDRAVVNVRSATPERRAAIDRALMSLEHALTRPDGLPRRPWYRHGIYAPGFYTGYGVKTMPGVREAIEQHQWQEAGAEIRVLADILGRAAAKMREAAR